MTQKGDPHTKLFSTSSEVILMSCILSQLNILCNNLIKPYSKKLKINEKGCAAASAYTAVGQEADRRRSRDERKQTIRPGIQHVRVLVSI